MQRELETEEIVNAINSMTRLEAAIHFGVAVNTIHLWIQRLRDQGWKIPSRAVGAQHFPPRPWWADAPPPSRRRRS